MQKKDVQVRCLNCKTQVRHRYCSACGQRNTPTKMPLWQHLANVVGEHLLLDSRMARTVWPFLFRPGFLTREYNRGRRVRYSAPVRLYLLMSLVLFLSLGLSRVTQDLALMQQFSELTGTHILNQPDLDVDADPRAGVPAVPGVESVSGFESMLGPTATQVQELSETLARYQSGYDQRISETISRWLGEQHPITRYVEGKLTKLKKMGWARARLAGFDNWLNLLPTAMFLLLPFCGMLLKLCMAGSRHYYVEHLVFTLHLHAYIYFLLLILSWLWTPWTIGVGVLVVAGYILVGLQVAYRGHPLAKLMRGAVFLLLYVALLLVGLGGTFALSLMLL